MLLLSQPCWPDPDDGDCQLSAAAFSCTGGQVCCQVPVKEKTWRCSYIYVLNFINLPQMFPRMAMVWSAGIGFKLSLNFFAVASAEMLNASQTFSNSLQPIPSAVCRDLRDCSNLLVLLVGITPLAPPPIIRLSSFRAPPWQFSTLYNASRSLEMFKIYFNLFHILSLLAGHF